MKTKYSLEERRKIIDEQDEDSLTNKLTDAQIKIIQEDYGLVQGLISTWTFDEDKRAFSRQNEIRFSTGQPHMSSTDETMRLRLTNDAKVLSITRFEREDWYPATFVDKKVPAFKFMSWNIIDKQLEEREKKGDRVFQQVDSGSNEQRIMVSHTNLNRSLNDYYNSNKSQFGKLLDVNLLNGCKFLMMKYVHKVKKNVLENKLETFVENEASLIDPELDSMGDSQSHDFDESMNSEDYLRQQEEDKIKELQKFKKDKRFVIFEAESGEKVIDYGGVDQMKIEISNSQQETKEVTILDIHPYDEPVQDQSEMSNHIAIFFTGDLFDQNGATKDEHHNWALSFALVSVNELVNLKSNEEKINYVQRAIEAKCNTMLTKMNKVFRVNSKQIENQNDWETPIEILVNKGFTQIGVLNQPFIFLGEEQKLFKHFSIFHVNAGEMIEKRKHDHSIHLQDGHKNFDHADKFHSIHSIKLPSDAEVIPCRNFQTKQDLSLFHMMNEKKNALCQTFVTDELGRITTLDVKREKVTDSKFEFDMNLCDYQLETVEGKQRYLYTDHGLPQDDLFMYNQIGDSTYFENSQQWNHQKGKFPIIAKNLALDSLFFQSVFNNINPRQYLYELDQGEKFMTWIEFSSYESIGLNCNKLKIATCTGFLFLTQKKDKAILNLMLIDVYAKKEQFALFKASYGFNLKSYPTLKGYIHRGVIQPNKSSKTGSDSSNFSLMLQLTDRIIRTRLVADVQELDQEMLTISDRYPQRKYFGGDGQLSMIPMIVDENDFIYYISRMKGGGCRIVEIDPSNNDHQTFHRSIYECKTTVCNGFHVLLNKFFFIMDNLLVLELDRIKDSRDLKFVADFNLSEDSRKLFTTRSNDRRLFDTNSIIHPKYIVQRGKIHYLFDQKPFHSKILQPEDLLQEAVMNNPNSVEGYNGIVDQQVILFKGSNQFAVIYRFGKLKSFVHIYDLPDSFTTTLIPDYQLKSTVSTFLQDGKILVECNHRYFIFTSIGRLISEVQFDFELEDKKDESENPLKKQLTFGSYLRSRSEKSKKRTSQINQSQVKYAASTIGGSQIGEDKIVVQLMEDRRTSIGFGNRMILVKMSNSNKKFVFFDLEDQQLKVYELYQESFFEQMKRSKQTPKTWGKFGKEINATFNSQNYATFKFLYNLQIKQSDIFKYYEKSKITEPLDFIVKYLLNIEIDDYGEVVINQLQHKNPNEKKMTYEMLVSIFAKDKEVINLSKSFQFKPDTIKLLIKGLLHQKQMIDEERQKIQLIHSLLPESSRDFSQLNLLDKKLKKIEKRIYCSLVSGRVFNQKLAIVWCGKYLMYSFLESKRKMSSFKDIGIVFGPDVEIQRVINTCDENIIQIVAKDFNSSTLIIVSWDLFNDIEVSMFQHKVDAMNDMENFIVKGMNQKLNYFVDQEYVNDLELGIPLNRNSARKVRRLNRYDHQLSKINEFRNQRKVHKDGDRVLGIVQPGTLNHGLCKIDLTFWFNIHSLGEEADLIRDNADVSLITKIFNGLSFFHYFAGKQEASEVMCNMIALEKARGNLNKAQEKCVLLLLMPDAKGHNSLDHALNQGAIKTFEMYVKLLAENSSETCLTKLMFPQLPMMIQDPSEQVLRFFQNAIFKPLTMDEPLLVPWDEDRQEMVFTSPTSIVTKDMINNSSKDQQAIVEEAVGDLKTFVQDAKQLIQAKQKDKDKDEDKSKLRKWILDLDLIEAEEAEEKAELGGVEQQYVKIEAIDMDWLFEYNNAINFINMLAKTENSKILVQKSIKGFISYIWQFYQVEIIKKILVPYLIYSIFFVYLCGGTIGEYLDRTEFDLVIYARTWFLTGACLFFLLAVSSLELTQLIEDKQYYFCDYWNWVDFASLVLNGGLIGIVITSLIKDEWAIDKQIVRTTAAFGCFLMWIKMFYWMRMFSNTAYYVKLISQTLHDTQDFMLMVFIILFAFGNFYYVLNLNIANNTQGFEPYVESYTGIAYLDGLICAYLISLGEFNYTPFKNGQDGNRYFLWIMFLLGSFINCVVFMNMLIAIMGETFAKVQNEAEQSGFQEQVSMIQDHIWLIDIKQLLKGKKYLIIATKADTQRDIMTQDITQILNKFSREQNDKHVGLLKMFNKLRGQVEKLQDDTGGALQKIKLDQQIMLEILQKQEKESKEKETQQKLQDLMKKRLGGLNGEAPMKVLAKKQQQFKNMQSPKGQQIFGALSNIKIKKDETEPKQEPPQIIVPPVPAPIPSPTKSSTPIEERPKKSGSTIPGSVIQSTMNPKEKLQ